MSSNIIYTGPAAKFQNHTIEGGHTATDRTPYVYLIGWSNLNLWYYGVRYAKGCHPTDFWVKYKTSSKRTRSVKSTIIEHDNPDVMEIRKIFSSVKEARKWEQTVLRRMNVVPDPKWLNKSIPGGTVVVSGVKHGMYGKKHSKETRKKISEAGIGNNHMLGKKQSDHAKRRVSEVQTGKIVGDSTRKKISEHFSDTRWWYDPSDILPKIRSKEWPGQPYVEGFGEMNLTEEQIKARSENTKDTLYWYDPNGVLPRVRRKEWPGEPYIKGFKREVSQEERNLISKRNSESKWWKDPNKILPNLKQPEWPGEPYVRGMNMK